MNYYKMRFEWDESKSKACLTSRGFDFEYVLACFFDANQIVKHDQRWDYGEDRFLLYGKIDHRLFVVVYTVRESTIRIISARKANQREVKEYEINTSKDR